MAKKAATVAEYLNGLTPERRDAIEQVRKVILDNLPKGYQESLTYGVLSYEVPLSRLPDTYNGQPLSYVALGSQKNYMSLYLMNIYGDPKAAKWFKSAYKAKGKKLDMGKSCVRFKTVEDLPLDLVAEVVGRTPIEDWIRIYRESRAKRRR
jgi:uncharacterized protein YdhG (YjbR/CyaY superfamily)